MSSSPLENLPTEILHHISSHLDREPRLRQDLQSLRLTSHKLNDVATRWWFRRFHFTFHIGGGRCLGEKHDQADAQLILIKKYGHFIREVQVGKHIGCKQDQARPLSLVPFLEQLDLLQHLEIQGRLENFEIFKTDLKDLMRRASLLAQPQDRALKHLRSIQLVCGLMGDFHTAADVEILFLVPQLQDLEIRGVQIASTGLINTAHARSTGLKSLHLESCWIESKFLITLLSLPSALVSLCLMGTHVASTHDLQVHHVQSNHEEFRLRLPLIGNNVVQGMLQQRHSLKWAFFRPNPWLDSWFMGAERYLFGHAYDKNDESGYTHYNYWRRKVFDNKDNFPTLFAQPDWDRPTTTCVAKTQGQIGH